ncbi:hypothetical protein M407DRAFT_161662 [Tulasnella calospora MUT 4182]|uniref:Uncharacterized protein n=1 Tax=Tulasnella calospora MUT 4182 TaxID=1051891 RepID=A0A0C3Q4J8_9AGAM|nr:hypothetical protein M407DRAFT_161662 [Tulasnella calospora MUT 4182]
MRSTRAASHQDYPKPSGPQLNACKASFAGRECLQVGGPTAIARPQLPPQDLDDAHTAVLRPQSRSNPGEHLGVERKLAGHQAAQLCWPLSRFTAKTISSVYFLGGDPP